MTITPNALRNAKIIKAVFKLKRNWLKLEVVISTLPIYVVNIKRSNPKLKVCPAYIIVESVAEAIP